VEEQVGQHRPGAVRAPFLSATHRSARPDASFDDRLRCRISVCCFARCQRADGESGFVVHPGNVTSRSPLRCACRRRPDCTRRCQIVGMSGQYHHQLRVLFQFLCVLAKDLKAIVVNHRTIERKIHRPLGLFIGEWALALRCRGGRYSLAFARATPATRRFLPNRLTLAVFRSSRRPRGQRGTPGKHGPDEEETAWLIHHQITTTRVREGEFSNDFHAAGQLKTKPG
jgi:hypothetical protein